jgi:hypothetical protein
MTNYHDLPFLPHVKKIVNTDLLGWVCLGQLLHHHLRQQQRPKLYHYPVSDMIHSSSHFSSV